MSTIKTFGVFAIMVGCFAILYPRFLHPILLRATGMHKSSQPEESQMYPPHMKSGEPKMRGANMRPETRHMRPGPPPGLRAAAEMERERAQQGSGRGMMGVVLPMYAVGIVLYLIYTLVKVFNKKSGEEPQTSETIGEYLRKEPAPNFSQSSPEECKTTMEEFLRRQKNNELEKLLLKADDKNITSEEMRALQKRLEETEAQMSSILRAMQAVSNKVDDVAAGDPDLQAADLDLGSRSSQGSSERTDQSSVVSGSEDTRAEGDRITKSTDSSPDLDSFEIVKKGSSSSELANNTDDDISQSLCSDVPESETRMRESESTESCCVVTDTRAVAPESEQGEATGVLVREQGEATPRGLTSDRGETTGAEGKDQGETTDVQGKQQGEATGAQVRTQGEATGVKVREQGEATGVQVTEQRETTDVLLPESSQDETGVRQRKT